jgi:hypothetical protein
MAAAGVRPHSNEAAMDSIKVLAGLATILALSLSAACANSDKPSVVTTPTEQLGEGSPPPEEATDEPKPPPVARVGNTLTLIGTTEGEKVDVTVVRLVQRAKPENEYSGPSPGNQLVAVQFRLRNVGTVAYSDSPSNGAKVVDTLGQGFDATINDTAAGPSFPGSVNMAPGGTALGYVTFEIPVTSKVAMVQFGLSSGFANQTGQWEVT